MRQKIDESMKNWTPQLQQQMEQFKKQMEEQKLESAGDAERLRGPARVLAVGISLRAIFAFSRPGRSVVLGLTPPAFHGRSVTPPLSIEPLDHPVHNQAQPGVHQKTEVNAKRLVTSGERQMWHQNKEVEHVAGNDGDQLLEKFAQHAIVVHPRRGSRCQKSLVALRLSLFANGEERSANSVPSLIYHPFVLDLATNVQYRQRHWAEVRPNSAGEGHQPPSKTCSTTCRFATKTG